MPAGQRTAESAPWPAWRETFHARRKGAGRGAGRGVRLDCDERRGFVLFGDEFQNIATRSFEPVLTEARKFGLCLKMAHQSLKELDDKLVLLILGNAQTQIYFRVSRQDAERLSKESANIVEQLYEREDHLIQEPEYKSTLSEQWEVAFHNMARLQQREAYVMIKGVVDAPELMRTPDNPERPPVQYPKGKSYKEQIYMTAAHRQNRLKLETQVDQFRERDKAGSADRPPKGLDFIR